MPELPDLLYVQDYLLSHIRGRTITGLTVKKPVVLRVAVDGSPDVIVTGSVVEDIALRGPFIQFILSRSIDLIANLMLAGRFQHQRRGQKPAGHLCVGIHLDDGSSLNLCDSELMAKLYIVPHGVYRQIPRLSNQGPDILSPAFSREMFHTLVARHSRKQVRVFLNDHSIMSAIGNAYADEILFDARIHPKTMVTRLSTPDVDRLYDSILRVMRWGAEAVRSARQPIEVKVRDHMKVRNRHGEPCPVCGTTIRREGVRGYDVYFCPSCQPATRKHFIDWQQRK